MELTPDVKKGIDAMDYESMLSKWRFAPMGDPMFQGESGEYFTKAMFNKKEKVDHVKASKNVGWNK